VETPLSQEQNNAMTVTMSMVTAATPTALVVTITIVQHRRLTSILSPQFALLRVPMAIMLILQFLLVQVATSAAQPAPTLPTA